MRGKRHFADYIAELNVIVLIFAFPFIHAWFRNYFNAFWDALLLVWIAGRISPSNRINPGIPPPAYILLFPLGSILISALFSAQIDASMKSVMTLSRGIGLAAVIYDLCCRDRGLIQRVVSYVIASSAIISLDAVVQGIYGMDVFGHPLLGTRAAALFSHPFFLALWAGVGLFLAIPRLLEAQGRNLVALYWFCIIVQGAAFIFSKTRAAWLVFGFVFVLSIFTVPSKKRLLQALCVIAVLVCVLLAFDDSLRGRALSIVKSEDLRWTIWEQSIAMIVQKFSFKDWLIGRGPGLFKIEYPQFDIIREGSLFPHLIAMELFYSSGLLGVAAFFSWLVYYVYRLFHRREYLENIYIWFIGFMPVVVLLICFINESFFSRYFNFTFWLFIGLSFSLLPGTERADQQDVISG